MTLSEISIRRPVFAWMLMAALIVFGAISFKGMGISQLPDVDFPVVNISTAFEGAAPEVMETEIVDVIEDAVMTVQGVRTVSSSSRNGSANISVEFELDREIDAALQEVQSKLAQAQRNLPREMDPPVITKTNPEDQPILWLTASAESMPFRELMLYVRDTLKDRFSTVAGVGEVFLGGYVDPNLRVWLSEASLRQYALSVNDVINAIQSEHSELPGGQIETPKRQFNVRTLGEARSPEEFGRILINQRGGQPSFVPIRLDQVAKVEEGLAEVRRISRFNGKRAVGLGIRKQRGSNAVEVAQLVKKRMEELRPTLPKGMELNVNFDSTRFIEESVDELTFTLILSAILTSLVCWMFLGSWSATFNVLLAIPTSIVGAFMVLYFFGFTLNTFTLLGLSLAIGIVVDDAIMVLENIVRHREGGKTRVQSALDGSKEITFAAMAATVAIVAIFLPVAFMKGVMGRFFFQFGVTMTAAVLLSLLEALTLTPMRCAQFVEVNERTTRLGHMFESALGASSRGYRKSLEWALSHRWLVILGSLAIFVLSMVSFRFLNKEFVPAQDQSLFMVRLQTPVGSSMALTNERFLEAEKLIISRPEVLRYFSSVGGFGGGDTNSGILFVTLKPPHDRPGRITQGEVMNQFRKALNQIPDVKASVQDLSSRGFGASRGYPVEFTVRGPDWDKLAEYSSQIMQKLEATGWVTDLDTDYRLGMPEVRVIPDRDKAAMRGVSVTSIGQTVNAMVGGVLVGRYPKGGHRYDIRVQLPPEEVTAQKLQQLRVRNNRGELIPLSEVVKIEERRSLQQITRYDRARAISIHANVKTGASQAQVLEAVQKTASEILPNGYYVKLSGSAQTFKESFASLGFALILGLVVSYMVLASQFNSFLDPITVLMALPFSLSGAFVSLLIGGQSLNIFSFIGLILLMGIVKKNSILLVDFTNQVRVHEPALSPRDALLRACPVRLRPILMTSVATIAGAVPAALAFGPGAETRVPMALAVIGGVFVSTLLTLYVVPCVYSGFSTLRAKAGIKSSAKTA